MNEDSVTPNTPVSVSLEVIEELSEEGRARKRQEQADARARGKAGRKGLVIVNAGNGKGKTTAAYA
jgi:CRISPR/Cas system-associated endonuclease/helicase Cas3